MPTKMQRISAADYTNSYFVCDSCHKRSRLKSLDDLACEHCGYTGKKQTKQNKFHAVKKEIDGIMFDSSGEAAHYVQLKYRERAGEISNLRTHVPYPLNLGVGKNRYYEADFVYDENGKTIVEDFKCAATITPMYRLKKQAMLEQYGIKIHEVTR